MKRKHIPIVAALLCAIAPAVHAEKASLSPDRLKQTATHVVVGKVHFIYMRSDNGHTQPNQARSSDARDWAYTRYLAEVQIQSTEKGEHLQPGELVYVRYWTRRWRGKGPIPTSTGGHRGLPSQGDTVRIYLARNAYDGFTFQNHDNGFNVIGANGFERIASPSGIPQGTYQATGQRDWFISFGPRNKTGKGTYRILSYGQKTVVEGSYSIDGNSLSLTDEKGKLAIKDPSARTGKYTYRYENGRLRFRVVSDQGTGRQLMLTSNQWKRTN